MEKITISWSDEDKCYIANCLTYPDLIGVGDTKQEATKVLSEMIEDYKEDEAKGKVLIKAIETTNKQTVNITYEVPTEVRAYIELYCLEKNIAPDRFIEQLVREHMKVHETEIYS